MTKLERRPSEFPMRLQVSVSKHIGEKILSYCKNEDRRVSQVCRKILENGVGELGKTKSHNKGDNTL